MEDQEQSPPPDQAHQRGLLQCHSPPDNKAAFVYDVEVLTDPCAAAIPVP